MLHTGIRHLNSVKLPCITNIALSTGKGVVKPSHAYSCYKTLAATDAQVHEWEEKIIAFFE